MQHSPLTWWKSEAPVAPVGHALRRHLPGLWTRFHSLPDSKRYAENDAERKELRSRHITIAGLLFQSGELLYLYRSHFHERRLRGKAKHQLAGRQLRDEVARLPAQVGTPEGDDEFLYVRSLVTRWQPDFYFQLLDLISDERESGVAFVSPQSKNIYCPYDGGMDVFCFTIAPLQLAAQYSQWQSARPDRL